MTLRNMFMVVALLGSAWLAIWADKTPDQDTPLAASGRQNDELLPAEGNKSRAATSKNARTNAAEGQVILRLRERAVMERIREDALADGAVFATRSWDPPPPKSSQTELPQAPSLPYTFVGKKQEAGEWEIYLALGEDIRIVRSNMVLDGKYQIGVVTPPTLSLTYLPLKQTQTLSIGNP
jgi:hypothetical protein